MFNLIDDYMKKLPYILIGVIAMLLVFCAVCLADTIGKKNNNPLNLKAFDNWQGMTGQDKFGHCIFESLEMGIRAGLINLKTHTKKHPDETLVHYLMTFAEQNGAFEAAFVADRLGISIETKLKDINLVDFFIALARFESKMDLDKQEVIRIKERWGI